MTKIACLTLLLLVLHIPKTMTYVNYDTKTVLRTSLLLETGIKILTALDLMF